jgi:hypothetical protein
MLIQTIYDTFFVFFFCNFQYIILQKLMVAQCHQTNTPEYFATAQRNYCHLGVFLDTHG